MDNFQTQSAGISLLSPGNIRLRYLYRDASNFKQHGEAIFSNPARLSLKAIEERIRANLRDSEFFIARQICLEEFFFDTLYEDDHPWHEFTSVEATTDPPFDPECWRERGKRRDIAEFLSELETANRAGWDELNVREDLKRQMEKQKELLRKQKGA
jgi:hypothetical protein